MHQLRQRCCAIRPAVQCIHDQLLGVFTRKGRESYLLYLPAGVLDGFKHPPQRVSGIDLILPIGADNQQMPEIGPGEEILQQVERRRIEPLQIIEEKRKRVIGPSEDADEASENELESTLRLVRLELRDRWLFTEDELQFRDEIDHEPAIWPQRLQKIMAPVRQLGLALAEKRPHKALKSLHQRRVGNVTFVLIELSRCEKPARRHKHLVQLMDDRGFADARISGEQDQFRPAALPAALERSDQGIDLAHPSIQLLWDQQPVWRVVLAKRKRVDALVTLPFG